MPFSTKIFFYLSHLEQYLQTLTSVYGELVYLALFCVIFLETGLFVLAPLLPSDTLIFGAGTLASLQMLNIFFLLPLFTVASVAGDSLNYLLGRKLGVKIFNLNFWILNRQSLEKTINFYNKYGPKTVFFGRFIPVVRSLVPFTAGAGSMKYLRFLTYSFPGCALWASVYGLAGYTFGKLSLTKGSMVWIMTGIGLIMMLPAIVQYFLIKRKMKQ